MLDGIASGLLTIVIIALLCAIFRKKGMYFIPLGMWPKAIVATVIAIFTAVVINTADAIFHYQSRIAHDLWWTLGNAAALFVGYVLVEAVLPPLSKKAPSLPVNDSSSKEPSGYVEDVKPFDHYEQPPN